MLGPVSLGIDAGQRWVLLGPNGGGKTTLLSVIGARLQPTSGTARVLGHTYGHADMRGVRDAIGHTSHTLSDLLPAGLRVLDVVLTGKRAVLAPWFQRYDDADREVASRRLAEVGAGAPRRSDVRHLQPGNASGCCSPERCSPRRRSSCSTSRVQDWIWVPATAAGAIDAAAERRPGLVVVLATHHLEEIPASSTHAALLAKGTLIASGTIETTLTSEHLRACFGIDVGVARRAADGAPPPSAPFRATVLRPMAPVWTWPLTPVARPDAYQQVPSKGTSPFPMSMSPKPTRRHAVATCLAAAMLVGAAALSAGAADEARAPSANEGFAGVSGDAGQAGRRVRLDVGPTLPGIDVSHWQNDDRLAEGGRGRQALRIHQGDRRP